MVLLHIIIKAPFGRFAPGSQSLVLKWTAFSNQMNLFLSTGRDSHQRINEDSGEDVVCMTPVWCH